MILLGVLSLSGCPKPAPVAPAAEPAAAPAPRLHHRARNAYVRAQLALADGDLEAAAQHLQRAMVFDPGSPRLATEMGEVRFRQGKWEAAELALERALELGGGDPARLVLCRVQVAQGKPALALHDFSSQSWRWASCALLAQPDSDPEPLLQAFGEGMREPWVDPELRYTALAYATQHQRYATALSWVEDRLAQDPWSVDWLWTKADLARDRHPAAHRAALTQLDNLGQPVLLELAEAWAEAGGRTSLVPRLQEPYRSQQLLALGQDAPLCRDPASAPCGLSARCLVSQGQHHAAAEAILQCTELPLERRQELALEWEPELWPTLRRSTPRSPVVLRTGALAALDAGEVNAALSMARGLPEQDPWRPGLEAMALAAAGQPDPELARLGHERLPGVSLFLPAAGAPHYPDSAAVELP
ncbi:MAG: tetratricopeptide repeat protein [Myxococcota bacterium]|nr:tetratricopeptide repeat protein [Myxococcota bacterium]